MDQCVLKSVDTLSRSLSMNKNLAGTVQDRTNQTQFMGRNINERTVPNPLDPPGNNNPARFSLHVGADDLP